jgi:hypothetical protein
VANVIDESVETQAILERMADVRYDLDEDVQEIVEGAREMSQWRSYVRAYPWWCLGGALALGYLLVPRRAQPAAPAAQYTTPVGQSRPATSISPLIGQAGGMLLAFVGNLAMRAVSTYASQQADKLFASPAAKAEQDTNYE